MTIKYVEPWRKYDSAYGKGELLIWSFTLESGIVRVDVGCCRLLLIADGYYWLQLVAAGCRMIAGCGWDTAGYCWLLLVTGWSLLFAGVLLAGEKVFEFFRDFEDLRLRQVCRRKSLRIFSSCWWFAAKTSLQAKKSMKKFGCWWFASKRSLQAEKSLNISGLLMLCG